MPRTSRVRREPCNKRGVFTNGIPTNGGLSIRQNLSKVPALRHERPQGEWLPGPTAVPLSSRIRHNRGD